MRNVIYAVKCDDCGMEVKCDDLRQLCVYVKQFGWTEFVNYDGHLCDLCVTCTEKAKEKAASGQG